MQAARLAATGMFLTGCGRKESPLPSTTSPTSTFTPEPTSTRRPRPTLEPTPTYPATPEPHFPQKLTEKNLEEYFENVDWDTEEIERRIKESKTAGKDCMFWPFEIEPEMSFIAESSYVYWNPWDPCARFCLWLDVPLGSLIRSPISGKVAVGYFSDGDIVISINNENEKMEANFYFASLRGLEYRFEGTPGSDHGSTRVGEVLFEVQEGVEKIDCFHHFSPRMKTPRTFIMNLSDQAKKRWALNFDWLRTDSGKIAY